MDFIIVSTMKFTGVTLLEVNKVANGSLYKLLIFIFDILIMIGSFIAAFLIRFDFVWTSIPKMYLEKLAIYMPIYIAITLCIYYAFHLYHLVWRFISCLGVVRIGLAVSVTTIINFALSSLTGYRMPASIYFMAFIFNFLLCTMVRFSYRFVTFCRNEASQKNKPSVNTMIIGAGAAGAMLIREMAGNSDIIEKACCIIDDNKRIHGSYIKDVPVVGGREHISEAVQKYNIYTIIYAIPSASKKEKKAILNICKLTNCKLQMLPGIDEIIHQGIKLNKLRDVEIEDLLGRDPITVMQGDISGYIQGRGILVTGGGGSIGGELCRQLASYQPKRLIILDIYENNAYDIQMELKMKYPDLDLVVLIASIRDEKRINAVFEAYQPDIVFHAAAHKHVPLMEDSPNEAVKNNVFGTFNTARAAIRHKAKRFVLISSDKAVNPTNIMGASKRICEMIVQSLNRKSKTEFVAVRFGNVLGSNGSVIPLFKKQIKNGGPVRVTHPEIIRYFMTIPEAVSLVLQAGGYANGGEIFILDMGEPVKILSLAENLIRLSGYVPYTEIPIVFTGLRPGEKLYEELLMEEEGLKSTKNPYIYIGKPIEMDERRLFATLETIRFMLKDESCDIRTVVKEMVPTYQYNEQKEYMKFPEAKEKIDSNKGEKEQSSFVAYNA